MTDFQNIVVPDARIADSSTKPRTAIKEDPTINLPKEMEKEGTRGKEWTLFKIPHGILAKDLNQMVF